MERFQGVSRMFQWSFKGGSLKIEGCSKSTLRVIQGSFKVSKRSSKGVSRQFERCFKEDSRVLKKESSVYQFHKKFQGCFKNLSMFCNFEGGLFSYMYTYTWVEVLLTQEFRLLNGAKFPSHCVLHIFPLNKWILWLDQISSKYNRW